MATSSVNQPLPAAKAAHVNLMTDTVIANMPADGLRAVFRTMLVRDPHFTDLFLSESKLYLRKTAPSADADPVLFEMETPLGKTKVATLNAPLRMATPHSTPDFEALLQRVRAMMGCGLGFDSLRILGKVVRQCALVNIDTKTSEGSELRELCAAVDADIVQAVTAAQKELLTSSGVRNMDAVEQKSLTVLVDALTNCQKANEEGGSEFLFERGASAVTTLSGVALPSRIGGGKSTAAKLQSQDVAHETFELGASTVPRLFCGLWQLSSPAWGYAPHSRMMEQFSNYASSGFTAYDMADHYGDAEIIFGRFRSSYPHPDAIFGATKYCVFNKMTVTEEAVRANVSERLARMGGKTIDLLQFHWQNYNDQQYIKALKLLEADPRVAAVGLCNFDTLRTQEILEAGVNVVSNQVQFSLIDSRPTFKMGAVCQKYNIKLLTYGTLCGGFLADKWLGADQPSPFTASMTPSQRKYLEMILAWGGWPLFQELLRALAGVAARHAVSVSNVATRWVLDFPYVGAVIVGARMGVSEHAAENARVYGWSLDAADREAVERVLEKSRRREMFRDMGDCGAEYR